MEGLAKEGRRDTSFFRTPSSFHIRPILGRLRRRASLFLECLSLSRPRLFRRCSLWSSLLTNQTGGASEKSRQILSTFSVYFSLILCFPLIFPVFRMISHSKMIFYAFSVLSTFCLWFLHFSGTIKNR